MKESEDKDLQDYLNGSDRVSAIYQSLQLEKSLQDQKPSTALDEAILQAARESVAGSTQRKGLPRQVYSIAASVCVAVLAVSLFLNNEGELTSTDLEALSIPVSDAPMLQRVEIMSADNVPVEDQNTASASAFSEQPQPAASRIATQDQQLEAEALSTAAEISLQEAVRGAERIAEPGAQQELQQEFEAIVQGGQEFDFDYRQSIETWLLEIQRLSDIGNEDELAEERRLFAESYPDMDIDSALTEIQLSN